MRGTAQWMCSGVCGTYEHHIQYTHTHTRSHIHSYANRLTMKVQLEMKWTERNKYQMPCYSNMVTSNRHNITECEIATGTRLHNTYSPNDIQCISHRISICRAPRFRISSHARLIRSLPHLPYYIDIRTHSMCCGGLGLCHANIHLICVRSMVSLSHRHNIIVCWLFPLRNCLPIHDRMLIHFNGSQHLRLLHIIFEKVIWYIKLNYVYGFNFGLRYTDWTIAERYRHYIYWHWHHLTAAEHSVLVYVCIHVCILSISSF